MEPIDDKLLAHVNGGVNGLPEVKIKTLEGESETYQVPISDMVSELIGKYQPDPEV